MPRDDGWRATLYRIIFEHDSPAGKRFDVALIACILVSVLAVILDSVRTRITSYNVCYTKLLRATSRIIQTQCPPHSVTAVTYPFLQLFP